ncbi:L-idonate 5-dehydrogenase [Oryzibacter oryziterrae]|uniref:L-idonate 5-dehydrogenase n=1 Tax=Oryzibacter oryziterrae TaxID=2766474 RepID=UPI001F4407D3|nr:L-idonate 5-dehydrogenase [Oryzibacter oryziterrae]
MRSVVIHKEKDLRIEERDVGGPGPGQVAVRVSTGGICGSDMHYFNHGGFGTIRLKEPMILGHEVSGVITALGAGVSGLSLGALVAVNPGIACGHCQYCLEGLPNHCSDMRFYGSAMRVPHIQGAFRDVLICEAVQIAPAEAPVAPGLLALSEPFSVALHAVSRAGSLLGKRVLVSGCGPIGALVVAAAHYHGAAEVIATDVVPEPLVIARKLGADRTIDVAANGADLAALAAGKGTVDVMFECSGNERALRAGLEALRPRGTVVQLGLGGDVSLPQNLVVTKELQVIGSFRFYAEFKLAVHLISTGRIDLSPLITQTFPVADALSAFNAANDRKSQMKVQLDFA